MRAWSKVVATLLTPPASCWSEAEFINRVVRGACASILLDLYNLYANAWNFGEDPFVIIDSMSLERVASVHLREGTGRRAPMAVLD